MTPVQTLVSSLVGRICNSYLVDIESLSAKLECPISHSVDIHTLLSVRYNLPLDGDLLEHWELALWSVYPICVERQSKPISVIAEAMIYAIGLVGHELVSSPEYDTLVSRMWIMLHCASHMGDEAMSSAEELVQLADRAVPDQRLAMAMCTAYALLARIAHTMRKYNKHEETRDGCVRMMNMVIANGISPSILMNKVLWDADGVMSSLETIEELSDASRLRK